METTTTLELGHELMFDEVNFNRAMQKASKISAKIIEMGKVYSDLGFGRFTQEVYKELTKSATGKIRERMQKEIECDLNKFSSPLMRTNHHSVDEFLAPLDKSIKAVQDAIYTTANELSHRNEIGFPFTTETFKISNDQVVVEGLEEFYTTRVTNEKQLELYEKLLSLQQMHNETVEYLIQSKIKVPLISGDNAPCFLPLNYVPNPNSFLGVGTTKGDRRIDIDLLAQIK